MIRMRRRDHAATPDAITTLRVAVDDVVGPRCGASTASLAAGGGLGVEKAPFLIIGETGADLGRS
jgi:hypothetical protein